MSTDKNQKSSSSSSLTKIFSHLTRTLSFSSKKNKTTVRQVQPTIKTTISTPKSVPSIRRHPPPVISRNIMQHVNMYHSNDDDDDNSRSSLQLDLSLFNISMDNLDYQQQNNWIDDVFHSTKIEYY